MGGNNAALRQHVNNCFGYHLYAALIQPKMCYKSVSDLSFHAHRRYTAKYTMAGSRDIFA